jgi:hypothetical protein
MRRFFVHVDYRCENVILANFLRQKISSRLKKLLYFLTFLTFEKAGACCDDSINESHTILARPATRLFKMF